MPTTNKDVASHQHMVTFTLGLGLDGELTFQSNYETAPSGDFLDIKQGIKKWPVPVADTPSALDDLWHTAVNGRGVYYSVRDPVQLAKSLGDMRNQLQARLGAGAAAATSNLQPVAGDNFAFTASFTTSTWTGDLKARTIDLATGIVSTATLWSAASLLDITPYTSRQIYTFDKNDIAGNLLEALLPAGGRGGLHGRHRAHRQRDGLFNTNQLGTSFDPLNGQLANATNASLVNYLRGDHTFGGLPPPGWGAPTCTARATACWATSSTRSPRT